MSIESIIRRSVLNQYGINEGAVVEPFGTGLINNTWIVKDGNQKYILQRINKNVFKKPEAVGFNIDYLATYLKENSQEYKFAAPLAASNGQTLIHHRSGYFRVFNFIEGSHTIDVVQTPYQAYEAAVQFGRFTKVLDRVDVNVLKITIPDFHNLSLRYRQFLKAVKHGNAERKEVAADMINQLRGHSSIVKEYEKIKRDKDFVKRVTHHDTKISNVLFDEKDNGICVIDLDTVMPGYFISDVGDMMRTYLSPVSEEEQDFSKIIIRLDFYKAIVDGYYSEMHDVLTATEKKYFFYAGCFMTYMQALRFLTDYLNLDIYYGERYPGHNFVRAGNQLILLGRLLENSDKLEFKE